MPTGQEEPQATQLGPCGPVGAGLLWAAQRWLPEPFTFHRQQRRHLCPVGLLLCAGAPHSACRALCALAPTLPARSLHPPPHRPAFMQPLLSLGLQVCPTKPPSQDAARLSASRCDAHVAGSSCGLTGRLLCRPLVDVGLQAAAFSLCWPTPQEPCHSAGRGKETKGHAPSQVWRGTEPGRSPGRHQQGPNVSVGPTVRPAAQGMARLEASVCNGDRRGNPSGLFPLF